MATSGTLMIPTHPWPPLTPTPFFSFGRTDGLTPLVTDGGFPCGPRRPKNIQCILLHVNPWCWIFHACVADQCLSKAEDGIVHRIRSRKPSVRMRLCHLVNICICLHIGLQRTLHYWLQESFKKKRIHEQISSSSHLISEQRPSLLHRHWQPSALRLLYYSPHIPLCLYWSMSRCVLSASFLFNLAT